MEIVILSRYYFCLFLETGEFYTLGHPHYLYFFFFLHVYSYEPVRPPWRPTSLVLHVSGTLVSHRPYKFRVDQKISFVLHSSLFWTPLIPILVRIGISNKITEPENEILRLDKSPKYVSLLY